MATAPTVSVVIPTHNQPSLLIETLMSVFSQTFTDYEIIIINDGSTDDTLKQLEPFADKVKIITQANSGIGAARNCGIDHARGKYVAMLDHDDLWSPEKLAVQVAFLKAHPECCGVTVPFVKSTAPNECIPNLSALNSLDGVLKRPLQKVIQGHNFLLTSSVLMFVRDKAEGLLYGTQRTSIEDKQFYLGLFNRGAFGIAGDKPLATYRVHESNFSDNATYYYKGLKLLRGMEASGDFSRLANVMEEDVAMWLSDLGRVTAVKQLTNGHRMRGMATYLQEFTHQMREGRVKFLLTYPVLLFMPKTVLRKRWAVKK